MTEFWKLPYTVIVKRPDDAIFRLASLLERYAAGEWDWQFVSNDEAMFRFAKFSDWLAARFQM
jgi:hypothetical protein